MKLRRAFVVVAELGFAGTMVAAAVALVLATASGVGGQASPRSPMAPATPAAPRAPVAPPAPDGQAVHGVTLALLEINARHRSVDDVVLGLGDSLVALRTRRSGRAPADTRRLAAVLVDTLRGRPLSTEARERLAAGLAAALADGGSDAMTAAGRQLDAALAEVSEALRAAGLGAPAIALVEVELRRLGRRAP